jgi:hypothetical protein
MGPRTEGKEGNKMRIYVCVCNQWFVKTKLMGKSTKIRRKSIATLRGDKWHKNSLWLLG